MTIARDHLRADDLTLPQIADAVGYLFPFAAAFRRHHGEPPGTWRQRERTAARVLRSDVTAAHRPQRDLTEPGRAAGTAERSEPPPGIRPRRAPARGPAP
ncbi:hypothetical protein [Streptomyces phaeofaciens]